MSSCNLPYIPDRLHFNYRPILDSFEIGDLIHRRCKPEDIDNPFAKISLREISNNIGTCKTVLISEPKDVLFNTDPESEKEMYEGLSICTLIIKELIESKFCKTYNEESKICKLKLLHDPLPCMYPHCNFDIWINDEKITKDNYDATLNTKGNQRLRTKIRHDLALMIVRKEIRIDFP